jgi:hypothetical protein
MGIFVRGRRREGPGQPPGQENAASVDARGIGPADFNLFSCAAFSFPQSWPRLRSSSCWSKFDRLSNSSAFCFYSTAFLSNSTELLLIGECICSKAATILVANCFS